MSKNFSFSLQAKAWGKDLADVKVMNLQARWPHLVFLL